MESRQDFRPDFLSIELGPCSTPSPWLNLCNLRACLHPLRRPRMKGARRHRQLPCSLSALLRSCPHTAQGVRYREPRQLPVALADNSDADASLCPSLYPRPVSIIIIIHAYPTRRELQKGTDGRHGGGGRRGTESHREKVDCRRSAGHLSVPVIPKAILTALTACPYVLISMCSWRNIMNLHMATLNLDITIAQTYTHTKPQ